LKCGKDYTREYMGLLCCVGKSRSSYVTEKKICKQKKQQKAAKMQTKKAAESQCTVLRNKDALRIAKRNGEVPVNAEVAAALRRLAFATLLHPRLAEWSQPSGHSRVVTAGPECSRELRHPPPRQEEDSPRQEERRAR
jgi:hypothetical protein